MELSRIIQKKKSLKDVKLTFFVDETLLMTFSTDNNGAFEAELDLSDYIGKRLKIEARKEPFETTDVSYEIGQEDIEVNIEMMAILQVEQDTQVSTEPVDHEDENHFFTKKNYGYG